MKFEQAPRNDEKLVNDRILKFIVAPYHAGLNRFLGVKTLGKAELQGFQRIKTAPLLLSGAPRPKGQSSLPEAKNTFRRFLSPV
ncbi:MAG: hypothetical protein WC450_12325 [Candidatus Omnitrophota bacterium]